MEKKPLYYDGSGDAVEYIQSEVIKREMIIDPEVRKNVAGNPFIIDWSQIKEASN
ncbi:hypothetical protein [Bacillus sp. AFS041924]|uniref:hypothetical protein n=1 Tax=Bacillus sp. AFS041924 TaxID=2033503 RepID=UPI00159BC4C9|nr:hypothetical protein [Bacillus sp. AFS041924]